ncbi:MAG: hypothetical protein R3A52_29920 [Polyangiales bacterium]
MMVADSGTSSPPAPPPMCAESNAAMPPIIVLGYPPGGCGGCGACGPAPGERGMGGIWSPDISMVPLNLGAGRAGAAPAACRVWPQAVHLGALSWFWAPQLGQNIVEEPPRRCARDACRGGGAGAGD